MKPRIVTQDGTFILDDTGFYILFEEPEPEMAHPRLLLAFLVVTGWTAFIGAGYSIYRAVEAVFG